MAESFDELLKATARSFYLTLRILPASVRPQIGLAYLLARATDTIADTEIVPPEQRLTALRSLSQRISGVNRTPLNFQSLASQQGSPAERILLEQIETALTRLEQLEASDLGLVRTVLAAITGGQELDLRRFGSANGEHVVALATELELDDYTYRVAGCVGEFWTRICRAHVFPNALLDEAKLINDGIRFGKGLQLVNILRDLPADLRMGRCYLPLDRLNDLGLDPALLFDSSLQSRFLPYYRELLDRAQAHLAAGWEYTNALPRGQIRLRLAGAWPILIGRRTIEKLRVANSRELQQRVKISRAEVRAIILRSLWCYPLRTVWEEQFARAGKPVASGRKLA